MTSTSFLGFSHSRLLRRQILHQIRHLFAVEGLVEVGLQLYVIPEREIAAQSYEPVFHPLPLSVGAGNSTPIK